MLKRAICLTALMPLCFTARAQDANCTQYYPESFEKSADHLILDGNTGEILDGTTKFAEGAKVQVITVEPNPFKYLYQVRTRSQPLDAAIALQFLGLLGLPQPIVSSVVTPPKAQIEAAPCDATQSAKWAATTDKLTALVKEHDDLLVQANKLAADTKLISDFTELTKGEEIPCDKAVDILGKARNLTGLPDGAPLSKRVASLIDNATKLQTETAAVKAGELNSNDACEKAQKKVVDETLTALLEAAGKMKTALETYAKAKPELDPIYERAKTVVSSPTPFLSVNYPDTTGGPRGITVDVARQDLRTTGSKVTAVGSYQLTVGESRLSISAGIGFSTIRERSIIRQASPGDTADTTVNRFGYDKNSRFRPSAVVQLNGHIWSSSNLWKTGQPGSCGVSIGVVVSDRANSVDLEYLAGVSLGFLSNVVLITPAFHAARVPELGGGFKIGDKVPSNLQDPLPIQKNFKPGFILTVTFKVR